MLVPRPWERLIRLGLSVPDSGGAAGPEVGALRFVEPATVLDLFIAYYLATNMSYTVRVYARYEDQTVLITNTTVAAGGGANTVKNIQARDTGALGWDVTMQYVSGTVRGPFDITGISHGNEAR